MPTSHYQALRIGRNRQLSGMTPNRGALEPRLSFRWNIAALTSPPNNAFWLGEMYVSREIFMDFHTESRESEVERTSG